jgi:hypothetical protein
MDSWRQLARATVLQAMRDILYPARFEKDEAGQEEIRRDALFFLSIAVDEDGYERGVFELAGICPRRLRNAVLRDGRHKTVKV